MNRSTFFCEADREIFPLMSSCSRSGMRNQVENPRYLSNAEIIYLFMPVYSNKSAMFISLFVMGIRWSESEA